MNPTNQTLQTIGRNKGMGAWEITIFPQGADQMTKPEKKIIVSTGLVEIVRQYPDTMEAHFLGCGECLIPCPDSKEE